MNESFMGCGFFAQDGGVSARKFRSCSPSDLHTSDSWSRKVYFWRCRNAELSVPCHLIGIV